MTHRLNGLLCILVLPFRLFDDLRQILENESARNAGPLAAKLGQIMADVAANINEEHVVSTHVQPFRERRDRVESVIHPARSVLTVGCHVVVELCAVGGVFLEEFEEVLVGAVSVLERGMAAVAWVGVVGSLEKRGQAGDAVCDAVGPNDGISGLC